MTTFAFLLPTVLAITNCLLLVLLVFGPRLGMPRFPAPHPPTQPKAHTQPEAHAGTQAEIRGFRTSAEPHADVTERIEAHLTKISEDIDWLTTDRMIEVTRSLAEPGASASQKVHPSNHTVLRMAAHPRKGARLCQ